MEINNKNNSFDRLAIALFVLAGFISMFAVYVDMEGTNNTDFRDSFTLFVGSSSIFVVFIIKNVTNKWIVKDVKMVLFRWTLMIVSFLIVLAGYYLLSYKMELSLAVNFAWLSNVLMLIAALCAYFENRKQFGGIK